MVNRETATMRMRWPLPDELTRRVALRVGFGGLGAALLPGMVPASAKRPAKVKTVIFLHQWGGPSHHDTVDMKPEAPSAVRGEFKPIASSLPGVPVCERLPALAKVIDRFCQIRSLNHTMKNHNSAGYYSLTGMAPPSDDQRLRDSRELFPAYGSIADRFAPPPAGVPGFVAFPHQIADGSITPGQHGSFLGKVHDPLFVGLDPAQPGFKLPELSLPEGVDPARLARREEARALVEAQLGPLEKAPLALGMAEQHGKALALLGSAKVRDAFDLSKEPDAVRERYGRTTYGQSCLLARRLAEAGCRWIQVYFNRSIGGTRGGWDTHGFRGEAMYPILKDHLLPITDQTLPTLILDLEERGLLETTLLVWVGEFGRSPRINNIAGRDHWPQCYPALLAGAGVKRGHVHGRSDKLGAYPASDPCRPEDLSATLFHLLGIDPATEIRDALNRPLPLSPGRVIEGVLA